MPSHGDSDDNLKEESVSQLLHKVRATPLCRISILSAQFMFWAQVLERTNVIVKEQFKVRALLSSET